MKKSLPFFCLFALFSSANAQVQITSSSMPSSGDTVRYSTVNPTGLNLNLGQKGANQTWDYSALKSNGQDVYEYISANKTPYLFYFFNQIGQKTADSFGVGQFAFKNIYSFYTKNTSVFKAEGLGYSFSGVPLASNYTDEDEIYQFPLDYNDSDVSTFRFKFSIPGQSLFSVVQKGTRINKVDGWGSIKTPYKTYNSVLRVKVIIDEVDSILSSFGNVPFPRKQVIYRWLSADEKIPVLEIIGTETGNTFTPAQIFFRDAFNGLGNPLKPRASFTVSKTSGLVNIDTFSFTDRTAPFAQGFQWQFSPSAGVKYVKNTSATSRNPVVVFLDKGLYSVSLTASNTGGSDDTTAPNLISIEFPLSDNEVQNQLKMAPNPSSGLMTVDIALLGAP
ncbi:MAG: hypothetical protein IT244_09825, partial [Bacteroidia bacterium]|nr:hypothetical protein [Bacteroidia bacterium]